MKTTALFAFGIMAALFGSVNRPAPIQASGNLSVEIVPFPDDQAGDSVIVRFKNNGSTPLSIIKPLDGSIEGTLMPHYDFKITDSTGKRLYRMGFCANCYGLWSNTVWPDDYVIEIGPGKTWELEQRLSCRPPTNGAVNISFEYTYKPETIVFRRRNPSRTTTVSPPRNAFVGTVAAARVSAHLYAVRWQEVTSDAQINALDLTTCDDLSASSAKVTDEGLKRIAGHPRMRRLSLSGAAITDDGLTALDTLPNLQELSLSCANFSDQGMSHVKACKGLRKLYLDHTRVTGVGIKELASLEQLKQLSLSDTRVDDGAMNSISSLTNLTELYLDKTRVTNVGIRELASLKQLKLLCLNDTPVSDDAMDTITGLTNLTTLDIDDTGVTDEGIATLSRLPNLRRLSICDTYTTDKALSMLLSFPKLVNLRVGSQFSDSAIARLKAARPLLDIDYYTKPFDP
jgi:Leucine-rich repeat (LRR) protein